LAARQYASIVVRSLSDKAFAMIRLLYLPKPQPDTMARAFLSP
jgi:hypothetical protein